MHNTLAQKFGILSLLKFTFPTIVMMVFMSLYTMVDGIFVSNLIGENALSAINIVFPASSIIIAISIMLATGGSAIIGKYMGEGKSQSAKEFFTLLIIIGLIFGVITLILGFLFIEPLITLLGSTPSLHDYCYSYLKILLIFAPFSVLQMLFQFFFVTAGKPNWGLFSTIAGGVVNILLDYILIVPLQMGIAGAALGTGIGYSIPAICGLIYFTFCRTGTLYFVKPKWDGPALLQSCFNGSSEMVTNLATAVTTLLFNIVMLKYLGENGVAAITIVLYAQFLLTSVYLGFSSGIAPILSYNYGEGNHQELHKIYRISMGFICISSILILLLSLSLSSHIVTVFVSSDSAVFPIARHGFVLFSMSYLITGFNIFASSMFTAFSNGKISAIISFLRTFVFIIFAILFLPSMIGANGIWLSVPMAELLTLIISFGYMIRYKRNYHY